MKKKFFAVLLLAALILTGVLPQNIGQTYAFKAGVRAEAESEALAEEGTAPGATTENAGGATETGDTAPDSAADADTEYSEDDTDAVQDAVQGAAMEPSETAPDSAAGATPEPSETDTDAAPDIAQDAALGAALEPAEAGTDGVQDTTLESAHDAAPDPTHDPAPEPADIENTSGPFEDYDNGIPPADQDVSYYGDELSRGIAPRGTVTLATLGAANKNDEVKIDGRDWIVVKKDTAGYGENKINCVYLIYKGPGRGFGQKFGPTTNYSTSYLRDRMTGYYKEFPTIQAIAVVPKLGDHGSKDAYTYPTEEMAGNKTEDILFAPSFADMYEWNNKKDTPLIAPLKNYYQRFYFRTYRTLAEVYGVINTPGSNGYLEGGINLNADFAYDVPAVWVNAGAIERKVNVYYVDTNDKAIGDPHFKDYTVTIGESFTMYPSRVPDIPGYEFKEWKIGAAGAPQNGGFPDPTLTAKQVIAGTDIFLVYRRLPVPPTGIESTNMAITAFPIAVLLLLTGPATLWIIRRTAPK